LTTILGKLEVVIQQGISKKELLLNLLNCQWQETILLWAKEKEHKSAAKRNVGSVEMQSVKVGRTRNHAEMLAWNGAGMIAIHPSWACQWHLSTEGNQSTDV
jgi:hypothetical protein